MKAYEAVYETIEDNEDQGGIQYIKLYNVGQKVVTRNCKGYLPSQVAFYLQASLAGLLMFLGPQKANRAGHVFPGTSVYHPLFTNFLYYTEQSWKLQRVFINCERRSWSKSLPHMI